MTPDELWEKYLFLDRDGKECVLHDAFKSALAEYGAYIGASVRARDVEICKLYDTQSHDNLAEAAAAAIAREPLP